jgi:signal transduction histidine kinase
VKRLPIRLKLTLAFTVVMALVLAATGLFLYLRLRADLDHTLSQGLYSRSNDISTLVQTTDTGLRDAARRGTRGGQPGAQFAQILDPSGRVFDASAGFQRRPLLSPPQLHLAQRGTATFDLTSAIPRSGPARVLATPIHAQGRRMVVVVGTSLRDRNQALANITTLLLIGGPLALLLAALAGYGLASAALRPVESMRARAAAISTDDLDQRLPLSGSRDELHRLGATLNEMLTRLEAGLVRERGFVADASHELRTPLTMLKTELELIARDRPTGEELDRAVAAAIGDTDRLARLADDLLVMARSDRDQFSIAPQPVRVADLLAEVGGRYLGKGVAPTALGESPASRDLELTADRDRLVQALINMVDNALRYGSVPVRLEALERDGSVELHVTDAGPGFPPEFLANAFERFARGDASHTTDGSGLGLAIVQTIARKHGGSAHAANHPGGGADVWISIPQTWRHAERSPRPRIRRRSSLATTVRS